MSHLTIAQTAAQQGDWSTVVHVLHQLLLGQSTVSSTEAEALLDLAFAVLESGDFQEQWDIAKVFSAFGDRAIAPLIELLQNEEAELESRWFAARILGDSHSSIAIRALVEQLQASEDEDLSQVVAEALANLGAPAIAALTNLLEQQETRQFAISALAQIRRSEIVTPLLTVVDDPQPAIRMLAIEALGSFHDARVPPVLVEAIHDPVANVRRAAIAGLAVRTDLAAALDLVSLLANCLWDVNIGVCQQAALALGRFKDDAAVSALGRVLEADATLLPLQLDTVRALGWIGTRSALQKLQQSLLHPLPEAVLGEIVTVLGRSPDALKPEAAQILIDALRLPAAQSTALRQAIATALGELKQPIALEPLIQLLADEDERVRLHAIAALKPFGDTARDHLQTLQTHDLSANLQAGIAIALREWQTELSR